MVASTGEEVVAKIASTADGAVATAVSTADEVLATVASAVNEAAAEDTADKSGERTSAPHLLEGPPPAYPAVDRGLTLGGQVPGPVGPKRLLDVVEEPHGAGGGQPADQE